jgi:hypothetical protein
MHEEALKVLDEWEITAAATSVQRLRPGRRVGRTLYSQLGDDPSDSDELVGTLDTIALATFAAAFSPSVVRRITAAMRDILDVHSLYPNCLDDEPDFCATCSDTNWPCSSVSSIYAALGVTDSD